MKGYVFTYGVDGFGADTAPAFEEGCFLNFDKAFARLVELNHEQILADNSYGFYKEGYGIDYYPENDVELLKAEENENWELFEELMENIKLPMNLKLIRNSLTANRGTDFMHLKKSKSKRINPLFYSINFSYVSRTKFSAKVKFVK